MQRGRGRGRGRGRASHYTFDIKAVLGDDVSMLNFNPEPQQPPPLFPPLSKLPIPLKDGPIARCKCNIRSHSIDRYRSTYSICNSTKKCVDKFRDRFTVKDPGRMALYDKRILAIDHFNCKRKPKKTSEGTVCIKKGAKRFKGGVPVLNDDEDNITEENSDEPTQETSAEKKDSDDEEEEPVAEDEEEEEDEEQITDYISSYFDNGEDYLDDEDDKFDDSTAW